MKQIKILSFLACIQSLAAFLWVFFTPSESESIVFLRLSRVRLALAGGLLALSLTGLFVLIWLWRSPRQTQTILDQLDSWALSKHKLLALALGLSIPVSVVAVTILVVLVTPLEYPVYERWAPLTFPLLHTTATRLLPFIVWVVLTFFEIVAWIVYRYRQEFQRPGWWKRHGFSGALIAGLLLSVTLLHWMILGFQLRFFVDHPAWYWKIELQPFTLRDVLLTALVLPAVGLAYWLLVVRQRVNMGLVVVFVTGCLLQFGFGYLAGGGNGAEAIRQEYLNTYHKSYMLKASENSHTILENIRQYETLYAKGQFTGTKPPGLMAFYIGLDQLVNGYPSSLPSSVRLERVSQLVSYSFPVLAMAMVFVLAAFTKKHFSEETGFVPGLASLLFILSPDILLLSLYPDQAIYPLLFLVGAGLAIYVIQRQSFTGAFLLGTVLYLAAFFAFTMLPLYPLTGLFLALNYWLHRRRLKFRRQIGLGLMILAGTVCLYLVFRVLLNYDFFPRFNATVAINHNFDFYLRVGAEPSASLESLSTKLHQIVNAAWLNNLEFATAVGFPLYLLFAIQAVRLVIRFVRQENLPGDSVLGAFLFSFIVLNLAGTAQGEVGRLWMFWAPMVDMFAAFAFERFWKRNTLAFAGLFLLQYGTVLLTYHFQDLRM